MDLYFQLCNHTIKLLHTATLASGHIPITILSPCTNLQQIAHHSVMTSKCYITCTIVVQHMTYIHYIMKLQQMSMLSHGCVEPHNAKKLAQAICCKCTITLSRCFITVYRLSQDLSSLWRGRQGRCLLKWNILLVSDIYVFDHCSEQNVSSM